jgi:hypothetical protein
MLAKVAPKKSPSPAIHDDRRHLMVSQTSSLCRLGAVGEDHIENHGHEHRLRLTLVSHRHGPGAPPAGAPPRVPRATTAVRFIVNARD